jgi:hypothetical protein
MPKLTQEQQRFIVEHLAQYHSPQEVADLVQEEFGIVLPRSHVRAYNPEQVPTVAAKWRAIFVAARAAFLKAVEASPIAHRPFRLRELESLYRRAKARGADALAASFLKQAAEEVCDVFTNRRDLAVSGSHFIDPDHLGVGQDALTPEQAEARWALMIGNDPVAAVVAMREAEKDN